MSSDHDTYGRLNLASGTCGTPRSPCDKSRTTIPQGSRQQVRVWDANCFQLRAMPCSGHCHTFSGFAPQLVRPTRHCNASAPVIPCQLGDSGRQLHRKTQTHRRIRVTFRLSARSRERQEQQDVQVEKSELAHTELIYFMFQMVS